MLLTPPNIINYIKQNFPEIGAEITKLEFDKSLYLSLGILANYYNKKVTEEDKKMIKKLNEFLDHSYRHGDSEVQNAIGVSCIEHLKFKTKVEAENTLTPFLYAMWVAFNKTI